MVTITEKNKSYVALARKYIAATEAERQDWEDWPETEGIEDFNIDKLAAIVEQLSPDLRPKRRPRGSITGSQKPG